MIKKFILSTAVFAASAFSALAGSAISADVLDGWRMADGRQVSAIRLTLAPGWKTYWRAPGDAGIPPLFNWSGSRNLKGVSISWPTPKVFDQNGMRSIGYADQVILPLHVSPKTAGSPIHLKLKLEVGVCQDICVPETLRLNAVLNASSTRPQPAIAGALADRPFTASEARAKGVTCTISPISDGLKLSARLTLPSTGGHEVVVVEAGQPGIWVSQAKTARNGKTLDATVEMVGDGGPFALNRSNLRFTVLGKNRSVDLRGCTPG